MHVELNVQAIEKLHLPAVKKRKTKLWLRSLIRLKVDNPILWKDSVVRSAVYVVHTLEVGGESFALPMLLFTVGKLIG